MRIRTALVDPAFRKLIGSVEVDETRISGENKNPHRNKNVPGTGGDETFTPQALSVDARTKYE
jgi:hypothetical protein